MITLKLAFRSLWRRKLTTGLNVAGLALGMTVFLFLMEFAGFHAGFDGFNRNADRLYRVVGTTALQEPWNQVSPALLALKSRLTGIEAAPTFMPSAAGVVTFANTANGAQNLSFKEDEIAYGNNEVFRGFTLPFLAGGADLDKPNTMVIAASAAQKYFQCGENFGSVVGKRLQVNNQFVEQFFTITGVMRDVPLQSHLRFTMLFSLQTLANPANLGGNEAWARLTPDNTSAFLTTYFLLRPGAKASVVEAELKRFRGVNTRDTSVEWHLQPVAQIHTGSSFNDPLPNDGTLKLVVIAASIALFVLALAWINYVNLSTAFGLSRAREIGVRKTLGASRRQLVLPYLLECLLLNAAALLLALTIVEVLQPPFNALVGVKLSLAQIASWNVGAWAIAAPWLGALVSGVYVAVALTGVNPIVVLRGSFSRSRRGSRIRSALVITQFVVSIAFIAATLIVFQQLSFMRNHDLGMNMGGEKEQLLVIDGVELLDEDAPNGASLQDKAFAFKQEAARLPFVRSVAGSQNIPGQGYNFPTGGFSQTIRQENDDKKRYLILMTDAQYFITYDMTFLAGKGYRQEDNLGDFRFRNVVMNEAATTQLGFGSPREALGQVVQWGDAAAGKGQRFQICGVVKNYHHTSLKNAIDPVVFLPSFATQYFTVRIATTNLRENMMQLEALYKRILPGTLYTARFASDIFQKQYEDDTRIGNVFAVFTGVAIVIACLGLFGLVAYSVESRTKEIGVRKVLGASAASIIGLLAKDFLKLVVVACVIACPLAWWLMRAWLQDFAYRVPLGAGVFVGASVCALVLALGTIAIQAGRAARRNPVEALRSE
jgi:putative ABC transport system permease protein